ncbi:spore coat associated protein CotJA [Blautia sp. HCP3S3_H10_1]|uniref:spore coat associated protein CotJA n=1 Tax=unclassified Blautia TaxID=2648079 RepID=UPI003F9159B4|nr:spore coat associated protein CotJA [Clostridia bacterium]
MNRSGCRPYNRTCGMMNSTPARRTNPTGSKISENPGCNFRNDQPSCTPAPCPNNTPALANHFPNDNSMYAHLKHLTPAMAYVPFQFFTSAYELDYALSVGTVFPQLCKPFCGKRGVCK